MALHPVSRYLLGKLLTFLFVIFPFLSWAQHHHPPAPPDHHRPTDVSDLSAPIPVDGQPLAANILRVTEALDYLGNSLSEEFRKELSRLAKLRDAARLQEVFDSNVLLVVHINPEARVKVARGRGQAVLQQAGYTPVIVKIINESGGTQRLQIGSPQSGPVYGGAAKLSMVRQQQEHLMVNENVNGRTDRFLSLEMLDAQPMTRNLSGLAVEYAIALIYSSEAGLREATITFNVGEGTQDMGFRGEVPVLFNVRPAVTVKVNVQDFDGSPTMARFEFVDKRGHVYPAQVKRLAPDLFFQKHIYRADGETVLLPPGDFTMRYGRGPEYRWKEDTLSIAGPDTDHDAPEISVKLERWVNPMKHGYFSGDHHIHASGCAHYTLPTQGIDPPDIFRQIKGEGVNVASVLTWGPGFDHQRQFFAPVANILSEPLTAMKYDIEVSGFGSQALGHLCLLNLKEQIYPGAEGSKGWPSWTLPTLQWAKAQGGVTGYPHSASGLQIDAEAAAARLMKQLDGSGDGHLDADESERGLMPEPFRQTDINSDGIVTGDELIESHERIAERLPNFGIPELNSVGAQEIFVTAALGACDFISTMNTARIAEWNTWYHLLNCGLALKAAGETDFPCMSGTRVGQGRTYVHLGQQGSVDYEQWCQGIVKGNSYVSDGYAHALEFTVNGENAGSEIRLPKPTRVIVKSLVAFSPETPFEAPYGGIIPIEGRRTIGNTVVHHEIESTDALYEGGKRLVELVVNGQVVDSREVAADGKGHHIEFTVPIQRSSWIAVRQFPQMHTNPINVLIGAKPIRASEKSALWAIECIDQLWRVRHLRISESERTEAEKAYEQAREIYRRVARESVGKE